MILNIIILAVVFIALVLIILYFKYSLKKIFEEVETEAPQGNFPCVARL